MPQITRLHILIALSIAGGFLVLGIALVAAAAGALFTQMRRYNVGDGTYESTFSNPEWWSQGVVSPSVTLVLGFLGFTAWVIASMLLLPRGVEVADAGGPPEIAVLEAASRNKA